MSIRTFKNYKISDLNNAVANIPVNHNLRDVSLLVGTHDLVDQTSHSQLPELINQYSELLTTVAKTFPNAYVTACSVIPKHASQKVVKLIAKFNENLQDLCNGSHVRFVDIISKLITCHHLQNYDYYTPESFLLNKSGSIVVRKHLLDESDCWRQTEEIDKHY